MQFVTRPKHKFFLTAYMDCRDRQTDASTIYCRPHNVSNPKYLPMYVQIIFNPNPTQTNFYFQQENAKENNDRENTHCSHRNETCFQIFYAIVWGGKTCVVSLFHSLDVRGNKELKELDAM